MISLACGLLAGLGTFVLSTLLTHFLSVDATPFVPSTGDVLEFALFGPLRETLLLLPFVWAFVAFGDLRPDARLRLLGASGLVALPFTLTHVISGGPLAWSILPASWVVVLLFIVPLSEGRPLRGMLSSLLAHGMHNGLLLGAAALLKS